MISDTDHCGKGDWIDLHCHTSASDGTLSSTELVEHAASLGLRAIALTDHDTVRGIGEAAAAADRRGIEIVPGVELSVNCDHISPEGQLHLIGLFIDPGNEALLEGLDYLRGKRMERIPMILEKLKAMGVDVPAEMVSRIADGGAVGRPHIARALLETGVADSMQEVFDKYLKKGAPGYVPKEKFDMKEAIQMVLGAGGIPVLAHPKFLKLDYNRLREVVMDMKALGLMGLEVYYSAHTPEETELYLGLAQELELLVSGGSDFHGTNKPGIRLGYGKGNLCIPYSLLDNMKSVVADSK